MCDFFSYFSEGIILAFNETEQSERKDRVCRLCITHANPVYCTTWSNLSDREIILNIYGIFEQNEPRTQ